MENLINRITIHPDISFGKPSIRSMRFSVSQMLELLASGMTHQEILEDYPFLEKEDILACLQYASNMANGRSIMAMAS